MQSVLVTGIPDPVAQTTILFNPEVADYLITSSGEFIETKSSWKETSVVALSYMEEPCWLSAGNPEASASNLVRILMLAHQFKG